MIYQAFAIIKRRDLQVYKVFDAFVLVIVCVNANVLDFNYNLLSQK